MRIALVLGLLLGCPAESEPVEPTTGDEDPTTELGPQLDEAWMQTALDRGLEHYAADSVAWAEHFNEVAEGDEADPRTGEDGMVRDAVRLCGDDRTVRLAQLTTNLRSKIGMLGDDAFECSGHRCTFAAAGEYDLDATLEMQREGDSFQITTVTRVDSASMTEEYLHTAAEWLQQALETLPPCE